MNMDDTQLNSNNPRILGTGAAPNVAGTARSYYKTQLCRRFMDGFCPNADKCTYAHGFSDLRRTTNTHHRHDHHHQQHQQEPKICRMFALNNHCTYGHNCRFLHSNSSSTEHRHQFNNAPRPHAQPQPGGGNREGYSSAGNRSMQTSTAATNAPTSTVANSSFHNNEDPHRVKFIFKGNDMRKIIGIYGDWI